MMIALPSSREEQLNVLTHLAGALCAAAAMWPLVLHAAPFGWQWVAGILFMGVGSVLMYSFSAAYHWAPPGETKRVLRIFDHINIYVMIACSYTPILISVVGGYLGWTVFGVLWTVVVVGAIFKLVAIGKYPHLSLFIYLMMGWSVLFVAKPVFQAMPLWSIAYVVLEGVLYSIGAWFYAHKRPYFHVIWHIFILLGTVSHWIAIVLAFPL